MLNISIHTPHARRDNSGFIPVEDTGISIHTPHARRDPVSPGSYSVDYDFNPHASCEA